MTRRAGVSWGPAAGRGEPPARRRSGGATGGEAGCPHGSARMGPTVRRRRGVDGGSGDGGNGRSSGCRFWRRKQWGSGGGGAGGDGFPRTASRWRTRRRPAAWCWTRRRRGGRPAGQQRRRSAVAATATGSRGRRRAASAVAGRGARSQGAPPGEFGWRRRGAGAFCAVEGRWHRGCGELWPECAAASRKQLARRRPSRPCAHAATIRPRGDLGE